jgi:C_GCAxxG_C_C family probable redox protein
MRKRGDTGISRRVFFTSASGLLIGSRLVAIPSIFPDFFSDNQELREDLTPEELKWVEKSSMAQEIRNYFGFDYSCSESLLLSSLKFMKKPENLVWHAAGFGGGLYHRDLCGFLTGGVMALGLAAGDLKMERKEAKKKSAMSVSVYWKWWKEMAPIHCSEIRKKGVSSNVCSRIGQLAAAKTEELIISIKNKSLCKK